MAHRLLEKVGSKIRSLRQTPPLEATLPPPSTPSLAPSQPAFQPATQPTPQPAYQPTPSPSASTDSETSLPSLQERLWNRAYDELKASEPKVVEVYEKILSARLRRNDSTSVAFESTGNKIGKTPETRCHQMQQLVQVGLDQTQKEASIKRGIEEGLQAVQAVRVVVDKAVQAAPEAAVAWVGVCLGMNWYWNLVCLLLDENRAEISCAGLRDELENHIVRLYQKLLLYQMWSVCLYHRNWAAVVLRDVFRLDDWASRLSDIQNDEAAVQRDSEQYNTEQSKAYLRDLAIAASSQEMKLQAIYLAIQDQTRQQEKRHQDDKDKQCLKDLRETDPRDDKTRIQDTKGGLLRDSYRWILDHDDFRRWRDDP
ncbi:hypothetical protein B0J13DRAFT_460790, partial [Dactylonectria estremocensis]